MSSITDYAEELRQALAFYFGAYHGGLDHKRDVAHCDEDECIQIRNLVNKQPAALLALQSAADARDAEIERLRHHLRGAVSSIKVNDAGQPIERACPWTLDWYAAASAELGGQGFDARPQFEKGYEAGSAFAKSYIEDLERRHTSAIDAAVLVERERCSSIAARHVLEGHNGQKCGTPGTLSCGVAICAAIAAEE